MVFSFLLAMASRLKVWSLSVVPPMKEMCLKVWQWAARLWEGGNSRVT